MVSQQKGITELNLLQYFSFKHVKGSRKKKISTEPERSTEPEITSEWGIKGERHIEVIWEVGLYEFRASGKWY